MNKSIITCLLVSIVSGCTMFEIDNSEYLEANTIESEQTLALNDMSILKNIDPDNRPNKRSDDQKWRMIDATPNKVQKNINHYVRGIMQDLLVNLQYVNNSTPIAVSDFLFLDSDFNTSTLLGKQLAEAFSHEVHKLGIPVLDYKLTDYIRVTFNGDLALSKDYLDLSEDIPIRYILTGTLVNDRDTIIVNARIVGIQSKAIVASAQGVIPNEIITNIQEYNSNDGLY